jgi:hypothetical protein
MTKKESRLLNMFSEVVAHYLASDHTDVVGSAVLGAACAKVFGESEYSEEFREAVAVAMTARAVELLGDTLGSKAVH